MKIPLRPPSSPLQDAILAQLGNGRQTKQTLSRAFACPAHRLTRSLRSLITEGKIKQEILNGQTYYSSTLSKEQGQ